MTEIRFSYNWNNKLQCKAFTTVRLLSNKSYNVNDIVKIIYKDESFNAKIIDIKEFYFADINNYIAFLDTGYCIEEHQLILRRMYKNVNWNTQKLLLILLRRL